jgi:hypothetical protein
MTGCTCLQDDEQSDPTRTTEQFCGTQDADGFAYGCDPSECKDGCPTLNTPARKQPPKRKDRKKKKTNWWVWVMLGLVILLATVLLVMLARSNY